MIADALPANTVNSLAVRVITVAHQPSTKTPICAAYLPDAPMDTWYPIVTVFDCVIWPAADIAVVAIVYHYMPQVITAARAVRIRIVFHLNSSRRKLQFTHATNQTASTDSHCSDCSIPLRAQAAILARRRNRAESFNLFRLSVAPVLPVIPEMLLA